MACYCMDAIRLGGNVWVKIPLCSGKCELWENDRRTIGLGESSCGYLHTYMFNHVSMRVLNCGYICRIAVILKYINQGMYVWKVFSLLLTLHALLGNCWAEVKFYAGTLTTHRCRSTSYRIWENVCMPPYIPLAFNFARFVRMYGSGMHHVQAYMAFLALLPPFKFDSRLIKFLYLLNDPHLKLYHVSTDGPHKKHYS
jgi:hypothetical protein